MGVKSRLYKAKARARDILTWSGYTVTFLSDGIFDLEAARESEMRKIKICLDIIRADDKAAVSKVMFPAFCKREIWCKHTNAENFDIIEIKTIVKGG